MCDLFVVPLGGDRGAVGDDGSNFMMMSIFMILAVILYIFRPNSLRRLRNGDEKQPPSGDQVSYFEIAIEARQYFYIMIYDSKNIKDKAQKGLISTESGHPTL